MPVKRRRSAGVHSGKGRKSIRKPTVTIIGAGRLGCALALALAERGYRIEAVVSRTVNHARRAARLIKTKPLALSTAQLEELPRSDIIFITTPDDQVEEVATELASTTSCIRQLEDFEEDKGNQGRTALHASGALSSDALQSLRDAGFATGSMHPLVSVSDPVQGAKSLGSAFFCLEGSAAAVSVARRIVRALRAQSFSISAQNKALYHAAAVMASGHITALFDIAMEMLAHCGLTPQRARKVLLPLLRSTLENLYTTDPARALTGTFARADTATVRRHLAVLSSTSANDALATYILLGQRSLKLAKARGASAIALQEIALALEESVRSNRVKGKEQK
jgi:predicted short-subunit dehydrogenase-like oxidoreductase (DUF2520 family)